MTTKANAGITSRRKGLFVGGRWNLKSLIVLIIISATHAERTGADAERIEVLLQQIAGRSPGQLHGSVISVIPDLDGNGEPDLAIGAPMASSDGVQRSGCFQCVSTSTGAELAWVSGEEPGMELGAAITGPGDLDGDGVPDIVVGAPGASFDGESDHGSVIAYSGLTQEVLWRITEPSGQDRLGTGVVTLEDFDGDGVPEILASGAGTGDRRGRFYLISGANGEVRQRARLGGRGDGTGSALALSGDLDGDGFREILIGAPGVNDESGRVYIISRRRTPYLVLEGTAAGQRFGAALVGTLDANGDRIPDLVIGSPGSPGVPGQIHLLSGLDGSEIFSILGMEGEGFGTSLDAEGDIDGDGIADIAVGAPTASVSTGETAGAVLLFSGASQTAVARIEGKTPGCLTGTAIKTLPDSDGNGRRELVVGSPGASPACVDGAGSVQIVSIAKSSKMLFHLAADSFNPLGSSARCAGDVDGDGIPDLIVGVPLEDPNQLHNAGSVYVFAGRDGRILRQFNGELANDEFGHSVGSIGDINGDGLSDVVIGAPGPNIGKRRPGTVYAYSVIDGQILYRLNGTESGDRFGSAISGSADYDGDGTIDLLIGSPAADVGGNIDSGRVEIFSGSNGAFLGGTGGLRSGERFGQTVDWIASIDGDTLPDVIIGAPFASPGGRVQSGLVYILDGSLSVTIDILSGQNYFDRFGSSVAALGDLNADGIPDFLVGAPDSNPRGLADAGSATVYSGADRSVIHRFEGMKRGDRAGSAVANAQDTNGDGTCDYLVGLTGATANGLEDAGIALLVSGADGSVLLTYEGDDPGLAVGHSVASAGDVDGDGFPEIVVGGSGLGANGHGGRLTVLNPDVPVHLLARVGNVNRGQGMPANVLTVNGSIGDGGRRIVTVKQADRVDVTLAPAPSIRNPSSDVYAVFIWDGEPNSTTVTPMPFGIGNAVFPMPITGGANQPRTMINRLPLRCFGSTSLGLDGDAGSVIFSRPNGYNKPTILTIQAIVPDLGSRSPEGLSLSNAVTLIVE